MPLELLLKINVCNPCTDLCLFVLRRSLLHIRACFFNVSFCQHYMRINIADILSNVQPWNIENLSAKDFTTRFLCWIQAENPNIPIMWTVVTNIMFAYKQKCRMLQKLQIFITIWHSAKCRPNLEHRTNSAQLSSAYFCLGKFYPFDSLIKFKFRADLGKLSDRWAIK